MNVGLILVFIPAMELLGIAAAMFDAVWCSKLTTIIRMSMGTISRAGMLIAVFMVTAGVFFGMSGGFAPHF